MARPPRRCIITGTCARYDKPLHATSYVLHEGLIGVTGEEGLQEITYSTIEEEKQILPGKSTDGWLGITDKYWAVTLVPTGKQPFQPRFSHFSDGRPRFQADFLSDAIPVAPGQSVTAETLVFAGAKEVATIDAYEKNRQIRQFELLIDWGWFYFITKPMFWLIDTLYRFLGNFGLAILATTVVVKAVFFPLANKSYVSMANMKKVQPKMLEIREKYADDKMKQQQAMMELYKTEKINPLAGCWPILIQIPVFFALYKVLYITIEMRHAPFFGWIHDLAAPDPTSLFNLFGLLPFAVPDFLLIGVWPLIMGVTMFLQMRMNPTPPDPTQAMLFNWMPLDLYVHACVVPGRSRHLLGMEQFPFDPAAGRDHEAAGRQDRALGQSGRDIQTKTYTGRIAASLSRPALCGPFLCCLSLCEASEILRLAISATYSGKPVPTAPCACRRRPAHRLPRARRRWPAGIAPSPRCMTARRGGLERGGVGLGAQPLQRRRDNARRSCGCRRGRARAGSCRPACPNQMSRITGSARNIR